MINFICLSNTKDDYIQSLTQTCIESICRCIFPAEYQLDKARILIVESNIKYLESKSSQQYRHATTIPFDFSKYGKFNYNYALNLGIKYFQEKYSDNDWYCFMNNDVIFDANWLVAMSNAIRFDNTIESFCCNLNRNLVRNALLIGYSTLINLDGCCILCKASVIDKIGLFDEMFDFYFQDDDLCEQLRHHGIKHAKVMNSILLHVASQTIPEGSDMKLLFDGRDKFIAKYGMQTYLMREKDRQQKIEDIVK